MNQTNLSLSSFTSKRKNRIGMTNEESRRACAEPTEKVRKRALPLRHHDYSQGQGYQRHAKASIQGNKRRLAQGPRRGRKGRPNRRKSFGEKKRSLGA